MFVLFLILVTPEIMDAIALLGWFVRVGGPFNHPVGPINNGILRLWVGQSLYTSALVTLIVRARLAGLDESLEEAARGSRRSASPSVPTDHVADHQFRPDRRWPAVVHVVPRQHHHRQLGLDRWFVDVPGLCHRHCKEHHQTVRRCRGSGVVQRHVDGVGVRLFRAAKVGRLVVADRVHARRGLSNTIANRHRRRRPRRSHGGAFTGPDWSRRDCDRGRHQARRPGPHSSRPIPRWPVRRERRGVDRHTPPPHARLCWIVIP